VFTDRTLKILSQMKGSRSRIPGLHWRSLDARPHRNNRFGPIGRCIYCGATDGLTEEHVVPQFLSGRLSLTEASCGRCAKITSGFESKCAQKNFDTALPFMFKRASRRRLPVTLIINGKRHTKRIEPHNYPPTLQLPIYAPPDHAVGRQPAESALPIRKEMWGWVWEQPHEPPGAWEKKVRQLLRESGASHVAIPGKFDDRSFVRLLAKIGYGYAIAQFGLGFFQPLILGTILDENYPAGRFVGGVENPPALTPEIARDLPHLDYFLKLRVSPHPFFGTPTLWADIRLFPGFGNVPVYTVLLGMGDFSEAAFVLHRAKILITTQKGGKYLPEFFA